MREAKFKVRSIFLTLALLSWASLVKTAPPSATDVYVSSCGAFLEDPIEVYGPIVPSPPPPPRPPSPPPLPPPPSPPPPSPSPPPPLPPPPPPPPSPPPGCGSLSRPLWTTSLQLCGTVIEKFHFQPETTFSGQQLARNSSENSANSCASQCLTISNCGSFSHNITTKACTFFSLSPSPTSVPSSSSVAWKRCSQMPPPPPVPLNSNPRPKLRRRLLQTGPEFLQWSDPATWPGGVIPGVGITEGANVTIPCNTSILLDVPSVSLGLLRVQGLLRFWDSPSLPQIYVKAHYVLVEGQLAIGEPLKQFSQKAIIELTPNIEGGRATLKYTYSPPADTTYPRDLGHKAFAVVGGQLKLHGLPGTYATLTWGRLAATTKVGDTFLLLDADVASSWPVGGKIVIASSDYDRKQAETFTIVAISPVSGGQTKISLSGAFQYSHFGDKRLADGFGGFLEQRAEVALLSRNIVIMGTAEAPPFHLEGGHLMIFMTPYPPQYIEGVEFRSMGQQGILGRYPMHFHILGSVGSTVCRGNSIINSNQRCVVLHASHNITVEGNVAFNNSGHCFITEEGGEMDNVFKNNLAILTSSVSIRISSEESDHQASGFWMSNPSNVLIGNVAAGSQDTGIWFELRFAVRGNSLQIPSLQNLQPIYMTIKVFANNTAHSCGNIGIRTYPNGFIPRINWYTPGPPVILEGINSYKNQYLGMFVHNVFLGVIKRATFADNGWGVHLSRNGFVNLTDSRIVGLSSNLGNPTGCDSTGFWTNCRPADISDCRMPLQNGVPGRSTGFLTRFAPSFGILIEQTGIGNTEPYNIINTSFTNFVPSCNRHVAISIRNGAADFWNPSYTVEKVKFSNALPLFIPPRVSEIYVGGFEDQGEQSQFYCLADRDGSLAGTKKRGYALANNTSILPPSSIRSTCVARPEMNAFLCPGVCYRSLVVGYPEPGFSFNPSENSRANFSYLKVMRVSDRLTLRLDGNLKTMDSMFPMQRYFSMNLLGNQTYYVEIVPSPSNPSFRPANITLFFSDAGECGQGLTIRIREFSGENWVLPSSNLTGFKLCPGVSPPAQAPWVLIGPFCNSSQAWKEIVLSKDSAKRVYLLNQPRSTNPVCNTNYNCSILWDSDTWRYDDSGLERRPAFYNPILSSSSTWMISSAPFGYALFGTNRITTNVSRPSTSLITYYFRKTFNLINAGCYSGLYIDIIAEDGAVIYLNNNEMLRINMPNGPVTNSTRAVGGVPFMTWTSFYVPINSSSPFFLVEGANTLAVEVHVWISYVILLGFDLRLTAMRSSSGCTTRQKNSTEVCDGLDNNLDGLVDKGLNGKPLTNPCSNLCGSGVRTCVNGYFGNCSVPEPSPEICDGKDNNCDGFIDNPPLSGPLQLNCLNNSVCSQGRCLPVFNATMSTIIWPRNSSGWRYHDSGGALPHSWKKGVTPTLWPNGTGPLGFDNFWPPNTWQWFGTTIKTFNSDQTSLTAYFLKSFNLTASEVNSTFSIDLSARRVDGAVIYLNGVELWRDNMPWENVTYTTKASSPTALWGSYNTQWSYNICSNCRRNSSYLLVAGTNVIAAEVHLNAVSRVSAAFDMDLYRNVIQPCSAFTGSPSQCVRSVPFNLIAVSSTWKYVDASLPFPTGDWTAVNFNDSTWITGVAPIGNGPSWVVKTSLNNGAVNGSEAQRTYYFRKTINVPDASCYFQFSNTLLGKDGAIVYLNGMEITRYNMPAGAANSSTFAVNGGIWGYQDPTPFVAGWFKKGINVISAELHRSQSSQDYYFDFAILGLREGVTCSPDPANVAIPWSN